MFWVRVSAKVTLRKYENSRCTVRLKLVKSSGHNCEPALFSDSIHNSLKVTSLGNPNPFDVTNEMLHFFLNAIPF